jgi:methyltransferase-like protein
MPPRQSAYRATLFEHFEQLAAEPAEALLHDEFEAYSEPVYFHAFMAQAAAERLQYLGDADFSTMCGAGIEPAALERLSSLGDVVETEQYLDFLYGRSLRSTLLCRADVSLDRAPDAQRVLSLLVTADVRPLDASAGATTGPGKTDWVPTDEPTIASAVQAGPLRFRVQHGELEVSEPAAKMALLILAGRGEQALSIPELAAAVRQRLGSAAGESSSDTALATQILDWYTTGAVSLWSFQSHFTPQPSERPIASPLARYEAARGSDVTNVLHRRITLPDPSLRKLLGWLDGENDRAALVAKLAKPVLSGKATLEIEGRRLSDKWQVRAALEPQVDGWLAQLARDALLVG